MHNPNTMELFTDRDPLHLDIHLLGTPDTGDSEESHCIYVVQLDPIVLEKRKFVRANPNHDPDKACFYVGLTGHTPEERFQKHKAGYKASRWVRDYGIALIPHFYEPLNRMPYEVAVDMEVELAELLREHGYAVWQN